MSRLLWAEKLTRNVHNRTEKVSALALVLIAIAAVLCALDIICLSAETIDTLNMIFTCIIGVTLGSKVSRTETKVDEVHDKQHEMQEEMK